MAEPQPAGQEGTKFSRHLVGLGWVAVPHRAVGDHEVGPQSQTWAVSEDKCLFPGPGDPHVEQKLQVRAEEGTGHLDRNEDIMQLQLRGPRGMVGSALRWPAQVVPKAEESHT